VVAYSFFASTTTWQAPFVPLALSVFILAHSVVMLRLCYARQLLSSLHSHSSAILMANALLRSSGVNIL